MSAASVSASVSTTAPKNFVGLCALLGVTAGIQAVDPSIASTALATTSRVLHMDAGTQALASSISTLALAATVITTGLIADRVGRKILLVIALALAAVGDVIAAIAPSAAVYMTGRAIAGIALGAVFGASFAYIRAVAPPNQMGSAMGIFAGSTGAISVVAGFIGSSLISVDWRLAFLVIPLMSVLGLIAVLLFLPKVPRTGSGPLDIVGQVLLALGIVGVLYGFSHAAAGVLQPLTWAPLAGGLVLLVAFYLRGRRVKHSFFPMDLLKSPGFLAAICIGVAFNLFQGVLLLQVSNLWQFVYGRSAFDLALGLLPVTVVTIIVSVLLGRALSKGLTVPGSVMISGACAVASCLLFSLVLVSDSYWLSLPALLLAGVGFTGLVPYGSFILQLAPPDAFGVVTSSRTTIGQFGYALGLAGGMVLVNALTGGGVVRRLTEQGVSPADIGLSLDAIRTYSEFGTTPGANVGGENLIGIASSAYEVGFVLTMVITAIIVAALCVGAVTSYRRWARQTAAITASGAL